MHQLYAACRCSAYMHAVNMKRKKSKMPSDCPVVSCEVDSWQYSAVWTESQKNKITHLSLPPKKPTLSLVGANLLSVSFEWCKFWKLTGIWDVLGYQGNTHTKCWMLLFYWDNVLELMFPEHRVEKRRQCRRQLRSVKITPDSLKPCCVSVSARCTVPLWSRVALW